MQLAFINTLPDELLLRILTECSPLLFTLRYYRHAKQFPLSYALVCRHWRNMVLSSPELWTKVGWANRYYAAAQSEDRKGAALARTQLFLSQSKEMPISVYAQAFEPTPALDLLAKHSARWKEAELELSHLALPSLLDEKNSSRDMCQLKRLFLYVEELAPGPTTGHATRTLQQVFAVTPALKHLSLRSLNPADFAFCWSRIQHLDLCSTTLEISRIHNVLSQCSSLTTLCVEGDITFSSPSNEEIPGHSNIHPQPRCLLPCLQVIHVEFRKPETLLQLIAAPALETLTINDTIEAEELEAFFEHSRPSIKHLTLGIFTMEDISHAESLTRVLHLSPTLQSLTVSFTLDIWGPIGFRAAMAMEHLARLLTFSWESKLCSNLTELNLYNADMDSPEGLLCMLLSRTPGLPQDEDSEQPNKHLESVNVTLAEGRTAQELFSLEELAFLEGLKQDMSCFRLVDGPQTSAS